MARISRVWLNIIAVMLLTTATAGATEMVRVELNKLEQQEKACRAYFVFKNQTDNTFGAFKLDLIFFNQEEIIAKRLAVNGAPLAPNRTRVGVFDLEELKCADIGHILLNGFLECQDADGPREDCMELVETASRSEAQLVK